jgi:uncharacterized protein
LNNEAVFIAALSGRALAQSARRAGYIPLVADCFGDEDTRALAGDTRTLCGALRRGFRVSELTDALEEMAQSVQGDVIGLILGPGFEDSADVVAGLQMRFPLLGCTAESIAKAKDPAVFFKLLSDLGIVHPQTSLTPPEDPTGWLSKRVGGCGGRHIRRLTKTPSAHSGRYFQQEIHAETVSALAIVGRAGTAFGFSRSWCAPFHREPFRFGGSMSAEALDEDLEARLVDTCLALTEPLGLIGLVSFDFLVTADEAYLVEVNPRPGASLDVMDDMSGTLFTAHVAACRGEDFIDLLSQSWRPSPRASAYVYADQGPLDVGELGWPEWVSDRPAAGSKLAAGAPIATVHAEADTASQALEICQQRISKLKAVL